MKSSRFGFGKSLVFAALAMMFAFMSVPAHAHDVGYGVAKVDNFESFVVTSNTSSAVVVAIGAGSGGDKVASDVSGCDFVRTGAADISFVRMCLVSNKTIRADADNGLVNVSLGFYLRPPIG